MIDTFKKTILDCYDSNAKFKRSSLTADRVRVRMEPIIDDSSLFAPDIVSWLRNCSVEEPIFSDNRDNLIIYTVSVLGITNRPLPGYKKAGFNLFKTLAKITAPVSVKKLSQCAVEFSSRVPMTNRAFDDELGRQICLSGSTIKRKNRLTLYSPIVSGVAARSDWGTLEASARNSVPVINIDWLDIDSSWEIIWNPCVRLKPLQKKLESKLIKFLDRLVEQVCASRCNVVLSQPGSFIDSIYLPHRSYNNLPALAKIDHYSPTTIQ